MSFAKLLKDSIKEIIKWSLDSEVTKSREDIPQPIQGGYAGYANQVKTASGSSSVPSTFNFSVTDATGGKVITVRHYDPRTDRSYENVYIITDKEDLGVELGQIITRESLSR